MNKAVSIAVAGFTEMLSLNTKEGEKKFANKNKIDTIKHETKATSLNTSSFK